MYFFENVFSSTFLSQKISEQALEYIKYTMYYDSQKYEYSLYDNQIYFSIKS